MIQQYQTDLFFLSQDIGAQSRTITDIRSKLSSLSSNLNLKAEETLYSNNVDLEKLGNGFASVYKA